MKTVELVFIKTTLAALEAWQFWIVFIPFLAFIIPTLGIWCAVSWVARKARP